MVAKSTSEAPVRSESVSRRTLQVRLPLVAALRPTQWTKNLLLFAALLFSIRFTQVGTWYAATMAFIAFCAFSSAGYLINDLLDIDADRQHPAKKRRPIASGAVSRGVAIAAIFALVFGGMALALSLGASFATVAAGYLFLSVAYSVALKHYVLIDLFGIAAGFVLRAAAGAVAIDVPISPWLYVCTGLAALFLALGKRRHELILLDSSAGLHRRNLDDYTVELVDQLTLIVTAAAIIAYSLYTISGDLRTSNPAMMLTIPFVLYGLFRYLYLVHIRKMGGSPEELLLRDRPLGLTLVAWVAACGVILVLSTRT
jgi:4-hydroxybenzoate polyprenyltransferase